MERHFPELAYVDKCAMIQRLHDFMQSDPCFTALPALYQSAYGTWQNTWKPADPAVIHQVLAHIGRLRAIENVYIRNLTLSMATDLVRIQFNCDGTHIFCADDYQQFVEENLGDFQ